MRALLAWFQAMGVDAAVDDETTDWLARGRRRPVPGYALAATNAEAAPVACGTCLAVACTSNGPPPRRVALRGGSSAPAPLAFGRERAETARARRIARQADCLEALESGTEDLRRLRAQGDGKETCFYRGAPRADLMIIGEAPGRDEDLAGKPFVGRAGQLLDKMLAAIGLGEADVHITNIVYWRPPGNRTPTPQEALACRPFLERQIELVAPKIVVAVGGAAAKQVFDVAEGIMRLRGKWREVTVGERKIAAIATLHPAYLLRTPAAKQLAWLDLLQIRSKL